MEEGVVLCLWFTVREDRLPLPQEEAERDVLDLPWPAQPPCALHR